LGIAAKQTGEAALDSATGVSGLGAAMSAIAGRVRTAITALSGFSKALIATGVGAAVVALGVILAYWEDISEFIQKSVLGMEDLTQGTNEYLKQAEKANRVFERQLSISEALGESEDELLRKRRLNNLAQQDQLEYALEIAKANEEKLINNGAETEELQAQFILIEDISEKLAVLETQEELLLITVNQRTAARQAEVQAIIDAQNAARQAAIEAAEFEPEGTSDAENKFKMELEAAEKFLADEEKMFTDSLSRIDAHGERLDKEKAKRKEKDLLRAAKNKEDVDNMIAAQEEQNVTDLFGLTQTLAAENQQIQGVLLIGEAIANTALAITKVTAQTGVLAPLVIPGILANGAIQVATIAANMAVSAKGGAGVSGGGDQFAPGTIEQRNASNFVNLTNDQPQSQVVLVTEDLNTVQNRVQVTEDRASI